MWHAAARSGYDRDRVSMIAVPGCALRLRRCRGNCSEERRVRPCRSNYVRRRRAQRALWEAALLYAFAALLVSVITLLFR